jgi:hypothetical protein
MIYLYLSQDKIEPHTDKDFAENVLKLGKPTATLTEQEWSESDGLARMIDGVLVLGKTDTEVASEMALENARQAEKELLATDWIENQLVRCSVLNGIKSKEYTDLLAKRMDLLMQRESWVKIIRAT